MVTKLGRRRRWGRKGERGRGREGRARRKGEADEGGGKGGGDKRKENKEVGRPDHTTAVS